ncbi:hypothetical protein NQ317_010022 [Molorchus minor]|uniref:THAP-type domain-containing protein n=1 Tax=Molorchus minor TaxID=1323400 RepID=A0ABQ9JCE9_9CUCU|nr:hypothetical protein NQ317_010022 [Molorchus minor]
MVVACGSNSARDLVSFFRIPSEYDNHKQFNKLASERRKAWINRLKRADLTESKIKNGRICSKHFISGELLLIADEGGCVQIYRPKDYILNDWVLLLQTVLQGEHILAAAFFHTGKRVNTFLLTFDSGREKMSLARLEPPTFALLASPCNISAMNPTDKLCLSEDHLISNDNGPTCRDLYGS